MKCPYCSGEDLKVTDSRNAQDLNAIRRRRECLDCTKRFTTFETVDLVMQVEKRDGSFEDFDQAKLIRGLQSACHHTRISHEGVRELAAEIKGELVDRALSVVATKELGEMIMKHLQAKDTIAYIRFACVYRRFKDIGELMQAIQSAQSTDLEKTVMLN